MLESMSLTAYAANATVQEAVTRSGALTHTKNCELVVQHSLNGKNGNQTLSELLEQGSADDYYPLRTLNCARTSRVVYGMHLPTRKKTIMKYLTGSAAKEAEIYRILGKHPRIMPLLNIFEEGDSVCIVFSYLEGGDLVDNLRVNGAFTESNAVACIRQLLDALAHVHSQDVAHCDVKLDNIISDGNGNFFLSDFGSAVHQSNKIEVPCGGKATLNYMAPELANHCGSLNHVDLKACDIFSAGIVMFSLLTGCFPWQHATCNDVNFAAFSKHYPQVSSLPTWPIIHPHVQKILLAMLNPDPSKRPTARQTLNAILALEEPSEAKPG